MKKRNAKSANQYAPSLRALARRLAVDRSTLSRNLRQPGAPRKIPGKGYDLRAVARWLPGHSPSYALARTNKGIVQKRDHLLALQCRKLERELDRDDPQLISRTRVAGELAEALAGLQWSLRRKLVLTGPFNLHYPISDPYLVYEENERQLDECLAGFAKHGLKGFVLKTEFEARHDTPPERPEPLTALAELEVLRAHCLKLETALTRFHGRFLPLAHEAVLAIYHGENQFALRDQLQRAWTACFQGIAWGISKPDTVRPHSLLAQGVAMPAGVEEIEEGGNGEPGPEPPASETPAK